MGRAARVVALWALLSHPAPSTAQGSAPALGRPTASTPAGPVDRPSPQEGWSTVADGGLRVRHQGRKALAENVLRQLREQPPLPGLPADVPASATVYLAPDEQAFRDLTGGAVPDWSAAVAMPGAGVLVIPVYASERTRGGQRAQVLRHEWAHLALHGYLEGLRIPRWFDEGYAEWASGWDASRGWMLRLLLATGRAPPLDSLTLDWPRDAASARAAYLLSATALEYLVRESGERGLVLMLERWGGGGSFEEALRVTYGVTPAQLEGHWRRYVKSRYGWAVLLSQSLVLWGVLGALLLALFGVRRRRDRERMARLRARELPERPDWWLEVPRGEGGDGPR